MILYVVVWYNIARLKFNARGKYEDKAHKLCNGGR